jgi:iron complex transport system substrate-binding protein
LLGSVVFGCVKKTPDEVIVTPNTGPLAVKHARLFSITYLENHAKLVKDYEGKQILLVPRGQEIPNGYEKYPLVRTPVERVFFMTATQVGILESLERPELFDSVVGVTVDGPEWTIPAIRDGIASGGVTYIPQNSGGTLSIESILALRPDIIFAGTVNLGIGDIFAQFTSAGLPYTTVAEWMESSGTAALEWVKYIAAFYNADEAADRLFEEKVSQLRLLDDLAGAIKEADWPKVVYGQFYRGIVYTQGGASPTAREYAQDAAHYYLAGNKDTGMIQISMEAFMDKARDADIFLCSSMRMYTPDKKALLAESPLFAEMKAFKNDRVYVLSDEYYMNGAKVAEKAKDTLAIFHPEVFGEPSTSFFVKLPN